MSICASARCGRTQDEFDALVQEMLPPGKLYSIDNPDRCFSKYWRAVSVAFKELEDCLCCIYANAIPCSPAYNPECDIPAVVTTCKPNGYVEKKTLLQRHAEEANFPLDCVELTRDALCEWVEGGGCLIGSIEWLRWLMAFTGFDGVTLDYERGGIPIGCHEIGKDPLCSHGPKITVTGCELEPVANPICGSQVKNLLTCEETCPKFEALRLKYFPVGVSVAYA